MITVWADGSITGGSWGKKGSTQPAECWYGWVAKHEDGSIVHHHSFAMGAVPQASANISEYGAVSSALRWLAQNGYSNQTVEIRSDSQIIIYQLSGRYAAHDERLRKLRDHCKEVAKRFPSVSYRWIPREENKEADLMSKVLQADYGSRIPSWDEVATRIATGRRKTR